MAVNSRSRITACIACVKLIYAVVPLRCHNFGRLLFQNALLFYCRCTLILPTVVSHLAVVVGLCTDDPKDF